ncbi:two-component system copper resistance phosphate regulon response regulator CusR [Roseimicrobium gellanilyticum]|uniref:Two-component system copper resistance phosphate regulon response regulator CusR n=1 Tax=Roseimicrobium gellanilyticum TaxID=748857 RepID=A0A366HXF1_9BACT|nr:heavy metal response regulator transcription factor [Roseimicrobium gellanilyticum]RBP48165.1 two-component system copper resistance phosphate regulon response regulator CusR [Roseimicrobium gellanilyticum]
MKILIVEDDRRSRDALAKGLRESGYVVNTADNGDAGLHAALDGAHDLIVLDVMLPQMDGWQVLERVRSRGINVPVLFLTARDAVPDRVRGLELGADDYMVKPFAWVEFLARVRTLLRRSPVTRSEIIKVADLELDLPRMKAKREGHLIDLTAKEFQLLSLLARRMGEVLSRTTIAELVWDINFTTDSNAVDVAMGRLRRKVDEPFKNRLIHTHRGLGYSLEDRGDA